MTKSFLATAAVMLLVGGCQERPVPPVAPTAPLKAPSCSDSIGLEAASVLVDQCLEVSPATRPPCHVENSCEMIQDEIRRGCAFIGSGQPSFCSGV